MGITMLLELESAGLPMTRVYLLSEELKSDPEHVSLAQALTLNRAKPHMGLKGMYGLFCSSDWWQSISDGRMPLVRLSGVVECAYFAGQDSTGQNNTVDLLLDDGRTETVGIYVNRRADARLFGPGCRVEIVYALDELKQQPAPDGSVNYSRVALEMTVSLQPAS